MVLARICYLFLPKIVAFSLEFSSKRALDIIRGVEYKCEKTFVVLNDRSLTSQKDGLSNSLNLTNQDFYVRLVDEKNKVNNSVLAGRSFSLPRSF